MNETSGPVATPVIFARTQHRIGMIWAEARGHAIGRGGEMPWHLPEDLAHFKRSTLGAPVIMGRRTWQSLPERFRPLPGRENFVVSRDRGFAAPGATVVASLEAALAALPPRNGSASSDDGGGINDGNATNASNGTDGIEVVSVWIMGGGQLYRAAMPLASELLVTRIEVDVEDADTFAPNLGPEWLLRDPGTPQTAASGLQYRFERYLREQY